MSAPAAHCNRLPFEGVLTLVDVPSDKPPSGARGHRVILPRSTAESALPTLIGMAVSYKGGWDGHDVRQKCGVIDQAELIGNELRVKGYVFARDFPEIREKLEGSWRDGNPSPPAQMGMSYELNDAQIADMRKEIWTLTRVTFTGAAILLAAKAAYWGTSFRLVDEPRLSLAAGGDVERLNGC